MDTSYKFEIVSSATYKDRNKQIHTSANMDTQF